MRSLGHTKVKLKASKWAENDLQLLKWERKLNKENVEKDVNNQLKNIK